MAANVTSVLGGMPEFFKAAVVGAGIGGTLAAFTGGENVLGGAMSNALWFGATSGVGALVAPMVTDDPMYQLGATAATGVAADYAIGAPNSFVLNGAVPAASLYLSRNL
jgi:hypothetical protein